MYVIILVDVVIFIIDIVCYEEVLYSWLVEYKFFIFCGFFGFGKIMILFSVL